MLEQSSLSIRPWRWLEKGQVPGHPEAAWIRDIYGPVCLGHVRAARLGRWPWLTPQTLEVFETDDASLVMTLRHGWFGLGRWRVLDAEERTLGSILTPHVLDSTNQRFARVLRDAAADRWQLLRDDELCATVMLAGDGSLELSFAATLEANPFLRMMLLGAALVQQPLPLPSA